VNSLAATRLRVSACQDLPAGISKLVVNTWETAEWLAWERVWRPELAKRGITPKMLELVGNPEHPTGIAACSPERGSRSGLIDWEADAEKTAVLTGMRRLVAELDRGGTEGITHESLTSVAAS
jgi:hypothetical protein